MSQTSAFYDESADCSGGAEFFMDLENVLTIWGKKRLLACFMTW